MAYLDFKNSWLDKPVSYDYSYESLEFAKSPYCLILKSISTIEECDILSNFLFKSQQIVRIQGIDKELLEYLQVNNQVCMYDNSNPRSSLMVLDERYPLINYFNENNQYGVTYSDESMYQLIDPFFKDTPTHIVTMNQLEKQLNLTYFLKGYYQTKFNNTWLNTLPRNLVDYNTFLHEINIAKFYGGLIVNLTHTIKKLKIVESIFYWTEEDNKILDGCKVINCPCGVLIDISTSYTINNLYEPIIADTNKPLRLKNNTYKKSDFIIGSYNLQTPGNSFILENNNIFDFQILMKPGIMACDVITEFRHQKTRENTLGMPLTDFWYTETQTNRNKKYYERIK